MISTFATSGSTGNASISALTSAALLTAGVVSVAAAPFNNSAYWLPAISKVPSKSVMSPVV